MDRKKLLENIKTKIRFLEKDVIKLELSLEGEYKNGK